MKCFHLWHKPKEEDIISYWYGDANLICCKCSTVILVPVEQRGHESAHFQMCKDAHAFGDTPKYTK